MILRQPAEKYGVSSSTISCRLRKLNGDAPAKVVELTDRPDSDAAEPQLQPKNGHALRSPSSSVSPSCAGHGYRSPKAPASCSPGHKNLEGNLAARDLPLELRNRWNPPGMAWDPGATAADCSRSGNSRALKVTPDQCSRPVTVQRSSDRFAGNCVIERRG